MAGNCLRISIRNARKDILDSIDNAFHSNIRIVDVQRLSWTSVGFLRVCGVSYIYPSVPNDIIRSGACCLDNGRWKVISQCLNMTTYLPFVEVGGHLG